MSRAQPNGVMKLDVALFVPCYVDQLSPEVAWATVSVLEREFPGVDFGDPSMRAHPTDWFVK